VLEAILLNTTAKRAKIGVREAVVYWFKRDLQLRNNKALSLAAVKTKETDILLICVFLVSL
jgi:deoxyribodipyrimidine photo-lyase